MDSVSFNGTNTIVVVKDSVNQFEHVDDNIFGAVQFRTGLISPRYIYH